MDFTEAGLDTFLNTWYRVTPHSDRTGIRLQGEAVEVKAGLSDSIISEGLVPGAVQVPGDGQPIILLRETVTGGYRKIATVISADLHLLGQLLPEDQLRFRAVSIREARQALWRLEERIARLRDGLV
jgi:allophanate hydrolase subunit 2